VLAIWLLSFVRRRDESKSNVQFTQIGAHRRFYNNWKTGRHVTQIYRHIEARSKLNTRNWHANC